MTLRASSVRCATGMGCWVALASSIAIPAGAVAGQRKAARLIWWTLPPTYGASGMGKTGKTGVKPGVLRHMCSRAAAGARYGRFIPPQGAALSSRHCVY